MAMTEYELNKIHEIELMIVSEIDRICSKYDIKYFIVAGSTLGAVRHKGFIPWDEDMDVGMLRSEYDRFVSVLDKELDHKKYFFQTMHTDSGYPLAFGKLVLRGTKFVEKDAIHSKAMMGIFIDIFPYDNVPDDPEEKEKTRKNRRRIQKLRYVKKGYIIHNTKGLKLILLKLKAAITPYSKMIEDSEKEYIKYNDKPTKNIVMVQGGYGYDKEIIPREFADDLIMVDFEDRKLPIFREYDKYLTQLYGNYMEYPPEDKRVQHDVAELDFGIYG